LEFRFKVLSVVVLAVRARDQGLPLRLSDCDREDSIMMQSRRMALKVGTASLALPLVHIRTAAAAGRLSVGLWDHWVSAGDDAMRKVVMRWAEKHKVDVQIDFITTVGNKLLLTAAAEAQAKTGHDVMVFGVWDVHNYRDSLEPLGDVTGGLQEKYGRYDPICEYLAKINGTWRAVPSSPGSQYKPSCGRISFFKQNGLDVQATYPAKAVHTSESDQWTWDFMLRLARPAQKAGLLFALGLGQTGDSVDWVGALFRSFGAQLVDEKGNVTVKSEPVQQVLDYARKLVPFLPRDVVSYDDASNNRALISGQSALIFNPPSAWAVAKRDNPAVAADCWTFPNPAGPKGRFVPYLPYFWGIWSFAKNKSAAKELLAYLCEREQVQQLCATVEMTSRRSKA
jgi:ABC-type glycerol-3-phosphate transport system substrate-binding protein